MSEFLKKVVAEANIVPDECLPHPKHLEIAPRWEPRRVNSVKGKTTLVCPVCFQKSRSRNYEIEGPYSLAQINALIGKRVIHKSEEAVVDIGSRLSDHSVFQFPILSWLVSPYSKGRCDKYYLVDVFARCDNYERCAHSISKKPIKVPECCGYRRFGRWGIAWNRLKAAIHWEVTIHGPNSRHSKAS